MPDKQIGLENTDKDTAEIPGELRLQTILGSPVGTWSALSRLNRHYASLLKSDGFWRRACQEHGYQSLIAGPSPRRQGSTPSHLHIFRSNFVTNLNWQRGRVQSFAQCLPNRLPQAPIVSIGEGQLMAVSQLQSRLHDWKGSHQPSLSFSAVCSGGGHWWMGDASGQVHQLGASSWQAHGQQITALSYDGNRLRSGDLEGWVKEWSLPECELRAARLHGQDPILYTSPTATVDAAGRVAFLSAVYTLKKSLTAVTESKDVLFLGCMDGTLIIMDRAGTECKSIHDCGVTALCVHGEYLVSGAASGLISLWRNGSFIADLHGHRTAITSLHAEEGRIVSASLDGRLITHYLAPSLLS